tara:strand:- start:104 stop:451 length:348 start_codon:yes stop_codon:yes gene_type:complete
LGVSEVNLVRRHLKLEPVGQRKLQAAIAEVDQLYGLDAVTFDGKNHVLNLAYDASRICLDDIEETLKNYGVDVSHDWWTHYKEDYYKFVDGNIKENASHEPWSCHKSPPSARGKR